MTTSTDIQTELANQLLKKRLGIGKTQAEVAKSAEMSPSYYSEIEGGKCAPPLHRIKTILNVLQFDETEINELELLAAIGRGLAPDDLKLPEDVQELVQEIRKHATSLNPRFIRGLRTKIREATS